MDELPQSSLDNRRILLLDSTCAPIKFIDWQKAIILYLTAKAEVLEEYDEDVRSVNISYRLPKVLRLIRNFKKVPHIKFTRHNIYVRDNWTCQYCTQHFPIYKLSLDHVIPRSRGGKTSWENVVTACLSCNHKKANKMPEEFHLKLMKKPVRPDWGHRHFPPPVVLGLKERDYPLWSDWFPSFALQ